MTTDTTATEHAEYKQATDYVVDLETLGLGSNAPVVAIGLCSFNRETGEVGAEKFYCTIEFADAMHHGTVAEGGTIEWWMKQDPKALSALTSEEYRTTSQHACAQMLAFLCDDEGEFNHVSMWGNGAAFDCEKLRNLFTRMGLVAPWRFWNERDVRTMLDLYPAAKAPIPEDMILHHALQDAELAATSVAAAFKIHNALNPTG